MRVVHFRKIGFVVFLLAIPAYSAKLNSTPTKLSVVTVTPLPPGTGWIQLPNTKLRSVCYPNEEFGCKNIMAAWNGGVADIERNIFYIWGGGHNDYSGNEVYALYLNTTPYLKRLNERSANPTGPLVGGLVPRYLDGAISSRHTYGGMAFIAHLNKLFQFGGATYPVGYLAKDIWLFDFATNKWVEKVTQETSTMDEAGPGATADYDPNTKKVFFYHPYYFYSYDADTNVYKLLNSNAIPGYHRNGIIDPINKVFYTFGDGGGTKTDISGKDSNYNRQTLAATGCAFKNPPSTQPGQNGYPGLTFNTKLGKVTAWNGNDTIYFYDPVSDSCTSQTFPNGPGNQQLQGTNGRFRYFPKLDVYVLLNDVDQNAYILRMP